MVMMMWTKWIRRQRSIRWNHIRNGSSSSSRNNHNIVNDTALIRRTSRRRRSAAFDFLSRRRATNDVGNKPERESYLTLYQFAICPYCNKVKALLDFYEKRYRVVEVNPTSKEEMKSLGKDFKSVPIAAFDEKEVMAESNAIFERILSDVDDSKIVHNEKWVKWADEKLAVLLFPNISRTYVTRRHSSSRGLSRIAVSLTSLSKQTHRFSDSLGAFRYVWDVPTFGLSAKIGNHLIGAFATWAFARPSVKRKYGITDEREALREALDVWGKEIESTRFGGGNDAPHTGDIAIFGCLRGIQNVPAFREIIEMNTHVSSWYDRMGGLVTANKR